ncbi:MAG TPA: DNA-formamidopyrimidine glycosylase [Bacillota bacterium]|nr:DNA-formamidopyrimidine glycosylase [Bacillota bacterium]
MPELPEVETVRRSLVPALVGKSITDVRVYMPKLLRNLTSDQFADQAVGRQFVDIARRGKYLLFRLSGGYTLVVHLRMTGQLRFAAPEDAVPKHTHIVLGLSCGKELRYTDIRQFGFWFFGRDADIDTISGMDKLGPEPLGDHFTVDYMLAHFKGRRGKLKALLLDQRFVAGVGNIYADEALFLSGLHPERTPCSITPAEASRLHVALRDVLTAGVQLRGTTFSDYVDGLGLSGDFQSQLQVYGRTGQPCRCCSGTVERIVVAGRGTHICSRCQLRMID